jgi:glycosyltransferase involved in cell wall biosynthesis
MEQAIPTTRVSDDRPRVLFVEGSTGFGGSGSILLSLLPHLDKKLFSLYIATYYPAHSAPLEKIEAAGIPHLAVSDGTVFEPWESSLVVNQTNSFLRKLGLLASWTYYWLAVQGALTFRFMHLLRKEDISVVVFNNDVHMHPAGIFAAMLAGKPIIVRKGGGIGEGQLIKKILTPWVDIFVPVSEATKADQAKNAPPGRIELIYPGIDSEKFQSLPAKPDARKELGLPQDAIIVGSASRLAEGKGQKELLLAAPQILEKHPNAYFCIAGDEDPLFANHNLLKELQALARHLGIADHVAFLGWCEDVREVLAALDIFVHCPTTFIEGLCLANLEAMVCGLPTVVSRNGGLPDATVDQMTGYVVEPGDITALAGAIGNLIEDPSRARQMGQNGKQRVLEIFEIQRMARDYDQLIAKYCHPNN